MEVVITNTGSTKIVMSHMLCRKVGASSHLQPSPANFQTSDEKASSPWTSALSACSPLRISCQ